MKRKIIKKLLEWKESRHRKPLLLQGARQVGKTWVLKEFGQRNFRRVHYINFEASERFAGVFSDSIRAVDVVRGLELALGEGISIREDLLISLYLNPCCLD